MFTRVAATVHIAPGVFLFTFIACIAAPSPAQTGTSWRTEGTNGVLAIRDGELAAAVHRAVRGAARLLEQASCARLLDEFRDEAGRPLNHVLSAFALTPPDSLSRIIFRDGRGAAACRAGIAAFTGPGSRVVFVCGDRFARLGQSRAEQVVIHEMLHTLGLGERPPLPGEIDRAIARRCGS